MQKKLEELTDLELTTEIGVRYEIIVQAMQAQQELPHFKNEVNRRQVALTEKGDVGKTPT